MKPLKKKAVLSVGVMMSLVGMGLNFQYALDDYGLHDNNKPGYLSSCTEESCH